MLLRTCTCSIRAISFSLSLASGNAASVAAALSVRASIRMTARTESFETSMDWSVNTKFSVVADTPVSAKSAVSGTCIVPSAIMACSSSVYAGCVISVVVFSS